MSRDYNEIMKERKLAQYLFVIIAIIVFMSMMFFMMVNNKINNSTESNIKINIEDKKDKHEKF